MELVESQNENESALEYDYDVEDDDDEMDDMDEPMPRSFMKPRMPTLEPGPDDEAEIFQFTMPKSISLSYSNSHNKYLPPCTLSIDDCPPEFAWVYAMLRSDPFAYAYNKYYAMNEKVHMKYVMEQLPEVAKRWKANKKWVGKLDLNSDDCEDLWYKCGCPPEEYQCIIGECKCKCHADEDFIGCSCVCLNNWEVDDCECFCHAEADRTIINMYQAIGGRAVATINKNGDINCIDMDWVFGYLKETVLKCIEPFSKCLVVFLQNEFAIFVGSDVIGLLFTYCYGGIDVSKYIQNDANMRDANMRHNLLNLIISNNDEYDDYDGYEPQRGTPMQSQKLRYDPLNAGADKKNGYYEGWDITGRQMGPHIAEAYGTNAAHHPSIHTAAPFTGKRNVE